MEKFIGIIDNVLHVLAINGCGRILIALEDIERLFSCAQNSSILQTSSQYTSHGLMLVHTNIHVKKTIK
jgi:hypothetical protein